MVIQTPTIKTPFKLLAEVKGAQGKMEDVAGITFTTEDMYHRQKLYGALNVIWYLINGDESEWQSFLKGESDK